jgi:DNA ligase-1
MVLKTPIPAKSSYQVSLENMSEIKSNAKSTGVDKARDEINAKFALAEALIKKVFVQHPNFDHIVKALLDVGLDGLAERVPLTVGEL